MFNCWLSVLHDDTQVLVFTLPIKEKHVYVLAENFMDETTDRNKDGRFDKEEAKMKRIWAWQVCASTSASSPVCTDQQLCVF